MTEFMQEQTAQSKYAGFHANRALLLFTAVIAGNIS
jgi:hypothetical protein